MSQGCDVAAWAVPTPISTPAANAPIAPVASNALLSFRTSIVSLSLENGKPPCRAQGRSSEGPPLVGPAVAGPQLHERAVGGGRAGDVQAQAGLHSGDGPVAV